jgi:NAD(P)-dependent dehydrogenase (short-subunit alcohol dehydrogenase family)
LIIDATGTLTVDGTGPEKRLADLDPAVLARAFAINAIGPALLIKHFADLLPRSGKSVFATLSARVGSIGDNRLGGWYAYRASKAALNQLLHTAAIEIARKRPGAVLLALHPGTVRTPLSTPIVGAAGLSPAEAAAKLLQVIEKATETGTFLDQNGKTVPW